MLKRFAAFMLLASACASFAQVQVQGPTIVVGGSAGIVWRGVWASGSYHVNDAVTYQGASYINTVDGNTNVPTGSGWNVLAASSGVTASPQHSLFYQPASGTQAQAQGDPNATTDGAGNANLVSLASPKVNGDFYPVGLVNDGVICSHALGSTCTWSGTDNTAAIQTAINAACTAGGGNVHLPAGTYNIVVALPAGDQPRQTGSGCSVSATALGALVIPGNNIRLQGAGKFQTTLSVWMSYGGSHYRVTDICPANQDFIAATNSSFSFPRTWRGSGIYIVGSTNSAAPTDNVTVSDLTLYGNAVINGNTFNPNRQDTTTPLPGYSQCNAWDTSNKGIFLQNDTFAANPNSGAFYPGLATYWNNITIQNARVLDFLGELIYSGNEVVNFQILNNELGWTNGDGISIGGGQTIKDNYIHDTYANGLENATNSEPVIVSGNTLNNVGAGIDEVTFQYLQQYPVYSDTLISNNIMKNVITSGVYLFSPIKAKIIGNTITDCAWRGSSADSASCITAYNNGGVTTVAWAPSAPTAVTPTTSTSGGSIATATQVQVAEAWLFAQDIRYGQTAASGCQSVTTGAGSTNSVTVAQPSSPPSNAVGWYVYANTGASCAPLLQSGFTALPLTTSTYTVASVATGTTAAQTSSGIYTPAPSGVDITGNAVTGDLASISNAFGCCGAPSSFLPTTMQSVNIQGNATRLLPTNTAVALSAPAYAPTTAILTGPPYTYAPQPMLAAGTYYFCITWLFPEGETPCGPIGSGVTVTAGQQINVVPNASETLQANLFAYKVYSATTNSLAAMTTQVNRGNSYTIIGNTFQQQYLLTSIWGSPPASALTGTTIKSGVGLSLSNLSSTSTNAVNSTVSGNASVGTIAANDNGSSSVAYTLGTTSATQLATYRPSFSRALVVNLSYTVNTAATTVAASLTYTDASNVGHTIALFPTALGSSPGQATGRYWMAPLTIYQTSAGAATLTFTAGTAGNVIVDASIVPLGVN